MTTARMAVAGDVWGEGQITYAHPSADLNDHQQKPPKTSATVQAVHGAKQRSHWFDSFLIMFHGRKCASTETTLIPAALPS